MDHHSLNNYLLAQDKKRIEKLKENNQYYQFRIEIEQDIIRANLKEINEIKTKINATQN